MADWSQVNVWDTSGDVITRVRRLERGSQYLRAGQIVTPSGSYAGVPVTLLSNGKIDLTSPDLASQGSIPALGVIGNFGFSATTTSITIYWDDTNSSKRLSVKRDDGTIYAIPASSLTISGLTSATQYGFLPFRSPFNDCGVGFVKGDAGTPQFAFSSAAKTTNSVMDQTLRTREPLSAGYMLYSTATTGTTSGTDTTGGGSPGRCVMLGTDIEPMGCSGYNTVHHPHAEWIHIAADGYPRSLNCTLNHPLYHADKGKLRADQFSEGDWIITEHGERRVKEVRIFRRVCTKVEVKMMDGHIFFANGYQSHNVKMDNLP